MNLRSKVTASVAGISLSMAFVLAACSEADSPAGEAPAATADEAMIAGVDAKSASLNAVGALVEIYRYSYGGYTGYGGMSSRSGTPIPATTVVPIPVRNAMHGRLDRPTWSNPEMAMAGAKPVGGASAAGGASPVAGGAAPIVAGAGGTGPTIVVEYRPFCSATLIGPNSVLTAKHCLQDLDYMFSSSTDIGFAVGPDASNPTAVYPIIDWEWETEVASDPNSLLSDLGSDVGVAHLEGTVSGVTPMAIGTLSASDVGKRFTAMGYGIQNNYEDNGTRKAGSLTLRGLGGNYADYAFGGLEGFLRAAHSMPAFSGLPDDYLQQIYYELGLLPDYQAFLGGKPGDAQPCYGDSGGPLIAMANGQRSIFGAVTSGFGSSRLLCDFGGVFATFGPLTWNFLQQALLWTDPCAGTSVSGRCEGDMAVRCTNRQEGKRRLTEIDCGLIGQTCGLDETGTVACVDPPVVP